MSRFQPGMAAMYALTGAYWRWRSRPRRGRPTVPLAIGQLIREMSLANPLWGAPRIHGELLKLGIAIGRRASRGCQWVDFKAA